MSQVAQLPTIADYLKANPEADPKDLLPVVLAETERMREAFAVREHEYKIANEVELDENLCPRPKTLGQLFRVSRMFVDAGLVPASYLNEERGVQPVPAVSIGIMAAERCGVETFTFLQHSFPHKGKIGIDSQLAIGMLNKSGKVQGRPKYEKLLDKDGNVISCKCMVTDKETGEVYSQTVTWDMVTAEGWEKPNGTQKSKWVTLRDLMFQYRAGTFVMRVHYPDVLMGMYTTEELEDMSRSAGDNGSATTTAVELKELSDRLGAAPKTAPKRPRKAPEAQEQTAENTLPQETIPQTAQIDSKPESAAPVKRGPGRPPKSSGQTAPSSAGAAPASAAPAAPKQAPAPPKTAPPAPAAAIPPTKPTKRESEIEHLKVYMKLAHPNDWESFDIDRLAEAAIDTHNRHDYADKVLSKTDSNWHVFKRDDLPAEEILIENGAPIEDAEQDLPPFISDPAPRPQGMCRLAMEYETKIAGMRKSKLAGDMVSQVKNHPELTNEEAAYLMCLAQSRAYTIERGGQ